MLSVSTGCSKINRIEEEASKHVKQSSAAFDREDYDVAIGHIKQGLRAFESSGLKVGDFSDQGLKTYLTLYRDYVATHDQAAATLITKGLGSNNPTFFDQAKGYAEKELVILNLLTTNPGLAWVKEKIDRFVPADDKGYRFFDHYLGTAYFYLGMANMLESDEAFAFVINRLRSLDRNDIADALQEIAAKKVPPETIRQLWKELL